MRRTPAFVAALLIAGLALPVLAQQGQCELQFISHGTFRDQGGCLLFEDDLGNFYEVVNPKGRFRDGATGTIHAEFTSATSCSQNQGVQVCTWIPDFTKKVSGTLIIRQLIECPGYIIDTPSQDYRIQNCEDFGASLCDPSNVGRKIQATLFGTTGPSICLGLVLSDVLEFRFIN